MNGVVQLCNDPNANHILRSLDTTESLLYQALTNTVTVNLRSLDARLLALRLFKALFKLNTPVKYAAKLNERKLFPRRLEIA